MPSASVTVFVFEGRCGRETVDGACIFSIRIGFINDRFALEAVFDVITDNIINRENAVFTTGFNSHIGNGEPVINAEVCNAIACKFK